MRIITLALSVFLMGLVAVPAMAEDEKKSVAPNVRIAVVDVSALLQDSKAAKNISFGKFRQVFLCQLFVSFIGHNQNVICRNQFKKPLKCQSQ